MHLLLLRLLLLLHLLLELLLLHLLLQLLLHGLLCRHGLLCHPSSLRCEELVPVKEMLEVPVPVLLADVLEVELAVVLVMVLTWRAFAASVTGRPTDAWCVVTSV